MGCGLDAHETPISDLWVFHTETDIWSRIRLNGSTLSDRCGARAVFHRNVLYVFGGFASPGYLSDLYAIDVDTGTVTEIETTGAAPVGRTSPLFARHGNQLYVWGGFNGDFPNELSVLDLETRVWESVRQMVPGRISNNGVTWNDRCYTFGGSKNSKMIYLDFEERKIGLIQTKGSIPQSAPVGGGVVLVGKYLFYFGGKAQTRWALLYACDLEKMEWFVFHVAPDGETVTESDGNIDSVGQFMMPRNHSFCMCYVQDRKEIISFMGSALIDPPPLNVIAVGDALGISSAPSDLTCVE
jgi:hypothetical protein